MSDRRDIARGLNILIIEGGGARGLSSLLILDETMKRLQYALGLEEPPSVREYFDVVAGTGTGAAIACMVGRLGIPVKQAIEHYVKLAEVFSDRGLLRTTTYKTTKLREVLKGIVKSATGDEDAQMMVEREVEGSCRTMVFAMSAQNMNASIPRIFRSYQGATNQMPDCAIWQVLSASMAHPEIFKPINIGPGNLRQSFVDGGLGCNNPTAHVLAEVKHLLPGRYVASVVCIGAGHPDTIQFPGRSSYMRVMPTNVLSLTKQIAFDAERVGEEMEVRFRSVVGVYFRFSIDQGVQGVGLNEWEKLGEVSAHTQAYMHTEQVRKRMSEAVRAVKERKEAINTQQIDGEINPVMMVRMPGIRICPAPSPVFTGRQDKIEQIVACISHGDKQRCVFVLYGLGGAGKTQLAFKTVEQTRDMWTDVVFVDATSHETITSTLASFAKSKGIGSSHENTIRWLGRQRERWLMVVDNADDPSVDIKRYFPIGDVGSVIVTTRIGQHALLARGPRSDHEVSGLKSSEAMELFIKTARIQEDELSEVEREIAFELFESFGYLALAIVQAGAYIFCSKRTISQYRDMFVKHRHATLEKYNQLLVKVDDYSKSVYTTWHMSYKLLGVNAQRLLHLFAFMHHSGIVEELFQRAAIELQNYEPGIPPTNTEKAVQAYIFECLRPYLDPDGAWNSSAFLDTMTELMSYSLVSYDKVLGVYTIHVLVHDWAGTVIDPTINIVIEHTIMLLAVSIDYGETMESLEYKRSLEVHISRVLERQPQPSANNASRFAEVYYRAGKWKHQEEMEQIAVNSRLRALGEEHSLSLTSMRNLAFAYRKQGRYELSATLLAQALEVRKRVSGHEHYETLMTMDGLSRTYRDQGRYKEAELLQLQVVDTAKRMIGEYHSFILVTIRQLALTYQEQGRYDEAEALLLDLVDARRRVSGNEHRETLFSVHALSRIYYRQRRYNQAESLQLDLLEALKRRLGDEHPDTLSSMHDLALTYNGQGRHEEAEMMLVQVLEANRQMHGEDHPNTHIDMISLAYTYCSRGRYEQAEGMQLQAVEWHKRMLGIRHPHTLVAMHHLLATYKAMGNKRCKEHETLLTETEEIEKLTD